MAGYKDDGTDDLIKREPMQVSPYSWAQQYAQQNNQNTALMQHFVQQKLLADQQQSHQEGMQDNQLTSADDLQTKLENLREAGQKERLQMTIDNKTDEVGGTGADGSFTLPENTYNAMPPSGKRKYDHVQTIQKNGKNYITLKPKAGAAGRTTTDDQYVK